MKKAWAIIITSLINNVRHSSGLLPVYYDYELDNALRSHNVSDSWYYKNTDKYINWTIEGQNRYCAIEGCHFRPLNNTYMFRDTYKDSIVKIFRYRLAQKDCKKTDFVDGKKCSWWYAYFPVLMQPDFVSYACKSLNYQGTWVPDNLKNIQKKAFMCYFNDRPYYWP